MGSLEDVFAVNNLHKHRGRNNSSIMRPGSDRWKLVSVADVTVTKINAVVYYLQGWDFFSVFVCALRRKSSPKQFPQNIMKLIILTSESPVLRISISLVQWTQLSQWCDRQNKSMWSGRFNDKTIKSIPIYLSAEVITCSWRTFLIVIIMFLYVFVFLRLD